MPPIMDVSALVAQMQETLATIHTTLASLNTAVHDAKLDELEKKRDGAIKTLSAAFSAESETLEQKRNAEREEIAERRRKEDKEREQRRREEDEVLEKEYQEEDEKRRERLRVDTEEIEQDMENLMEEVEEEARMSIAEGYERLRGLQERRRVSSCSCFGVGCRDRDRGLTGVVEQELNRLIEEQLEMSLPTIPATPMRRRKSVRKGSSPGAVPIEVPPMPLPTETGVPNIPDIEPNQQDAEPSDLSGPALQTQEEASREPEAPPVPKLHIEMLDQGLWTNKQPEEVGRDDLPTLPDVGIADTAENGVKGPEVKGVTGLWTAGALASAKPPVAPVPEHVPAQPEPEVALPSGLEEETVEEGHRIREISGTMTHGEDEASAKKALPVPMVDEAEDSTMAVYEKPQPEGPAVTKDAHESAGQPPSHEEETAEHVNETIPSVTERQGVTEAESPVIPKAAPFAEEEEETKAPEHQPEKPAETIAADTAALGHYNQLSSDEGSETSPLPSPSPEQQHEDAYPHVSEASGQARPPEPDESSLLSAGGYVSEDNDIPDDVFNYPGEGYIEESERLGTPVLKREVSHEADMSMGTIPPESDHENLPRPSFGSLPISAVSLGFGGLSPQLTGVGKQGEKVGEEVDKEIVEEGVGEAHAEETVPLTLETLHEEPELGGDEHPGIPAASQPEIGTAEHRTSESEASEQHVEPQAATVESSDRERNIFEEAGQPELDIVEHRASESEANEQYIESQTASLGSAEGVRNPFEVADTLSEPREGDTEQNEVGSETGSIEVQDQSQDQDRTPEAKETESEVEEHGLQEENGPVVDQAGYQAADYQTPGEETDTESQRFVTPLPSRQNLRTLDEAQGYPFHPTNIGEHANVPQHPEDHARKYSLEDYQTTTVHGQDELFHDDERSEDLSSFGEAAAEDHPVSETIPEHPEEGSEGRKTPDLASGFPRPPDSFTRQKSWVEEMGSNYLDEEDEPKTAFLRPETPTAPATAPAQSLAAELESQEESPSPVSEEGPAPEPAPVDRPQTPTGRESLASSEYVTPETLANRDAPNAQWRANDGWTPQSRRTHSTISSSPPSPHAALHTVAKQEPSTVPISGHQADTDFPTTEQQQQQQQQQPKQQYELPQTPRESVTPVSLMAPWKQPDQRGQTSPTSPTLDTTPSNRLSQGLGSPHSETGGGGGSGSPRTSGSLFQRMRNIFEQPRRSSSISFGHSSNKNQAASGSPVRPTRPGSDTMDAWFSERAQSQGQSPYSRHQQFPFEVRREQEQRQKEGGGGQEMLSPTRYNPVTSSSPALSGGGGGYKEYGGGDERSGLFAGPGGGGQH